MLAVQRAVALGACLAEASPPCGRRARRRRAARGARCARQVHHLAGRLELQPLLGEAGSDDRHPDLVLEARVQHGAEDDVGLVVRRLLHDARGLLHLVDREIVAAGEVDEDALGAVDGRVVEQRARDRLLRSVEGAVGAPAHAGAHHGHAHARHDRADIGEVEVDEAGHEDEVGDALHRLLEHGVGHAERLEQRRAAIHDGQQALVRDRDQRVDDAAKRIDARFGLEHALAALERERLGDDGDGEDAEVARERGHDGRGAGARAAPEAGRDEDHVGALEQPRDGLGILERGVASDVGVRAGAEALRQLAAELHLDGRRRVAQRLHVRVRHDELDAGELRRHHAAHRVATAAAEADDLDLGRLRSVVQLEERAPCAISLHPALLMRAGPGPPRPCAACAGGLRREEWRLLAPA